MKPVSTCSPSTDKARTGKFVSHIAERGRSSTTNGADLIQEPYLWCITTPTSATLSTARN